MAAKKKTVKRAAKREEKPPPPPVEMMPHQRDAEEQFLAGRRFQYHAWHRRAGKDWFGLDIASKEMKRNVGTYWHLLPKHIQARRAIWHGIDHNSGARFLELFFPNAVAANNTEMFVEDASGSSWQLLGSDNYDRMVGSNPRGVVFSEWALCDPRAWDYIRPILRANNGWAIFISTFRGRNHAWQMYNNVRNNRDWYVTLRTIADTKRNDGSPIISAADVEADRKSGMSERFIQQEYFCVPVAPSSLGPYARVFDGLEDVGAIKDMPELAKQGGSSFAVVGQSHDYTATLYCSIRGARRYIHGGRVARNVALHELIKPQPGTVLALGEDLRQDAFALTSHAEIAGHADPVSTSTFLEQCILSPTSVLTNALAGALQSNLEEDDDAEQATFAVYDALERLALVSAESVSEWSRGQSYALQDRAVI